MSQNKLQNSKENQSDEKSTENKESSPSKEQVAIGSNIIQVIGDRTKALFVNAPGLGYAIGGLSAVLVLIAIYFGIQGLRVEQIIPEPTPWALPTPAENGEILILVAKFERLGGVEERDPSGRIIEALQESLPNGSEEKVRFFEIPQAYSRGQMVEVRALSERLNATFTIWGAYDPAGTTVHFTIIPDKEFALRDVGYQQGPPIDQPKEFDLFFSQKLPSEAVFFTDFTLGQIYYWEEDYSKAFTFFGTAIEHGESGQIGNNEMALAYLHRGLAELFPPVQQWAKAIEDFQSAIDNNPELIPAYNNIGFSQRLSGLYSEAIQSHTKALNLAQNEQSELEKARALFGLGDVEYYLSNYSDSIQYYKDSGTAYKSVENPIGSANANVGLAKNYLAQGNLDLALEVATEVRDSMAQINEKISEGNAYDVIGDVYYIKGDLKKAEEAYSSALKIFTEIGDRRGEANAYETLGDVNYILNNAEISIDYYQRALDIRKDLGERVGQANAILGMSNMYQTIGEFEKSKTGYAEALAIYEELGELLGQANVYVHLGDLNKSIANFNEAEMNYKKALDISKGIGNKQAEANAILGLGDVTVSKGNLDEAIKLYNDALAIFKEIQNKNGMMNAYQDLGITQLTKLQLSGDVALLEKALKNLNQALVLSREVKSKLGEGNALFAIGQAKVLTGDSSTALENYNQALLIYREIDVKSNIGATVLAIGEAHLLSGNIDDSIPNFLEALEIFNQTNNDLNKALAMNDLAYAYAEKEENLDEAEKLARQSLELISELLPYQKGAVLDTLGWVYYKEGKLDLAKEALTEAYTLLPIPGIKEHLDIVLEKIGG